MRKLLLVLVLALGLTMLLATIAVNYQRPIRTISATDDSQSLVVYHRLPQRLVVLDPPTGRLLARLGYGNRVVGICAEAAIDFPQVEQLGKRAEVTALAVAALRPDLVVLGADSIPLAESLRRGGFSAWLVAPAGLTELQSGISRLGKLLGASAQADTIANDLQTKLASSSSSAQEIKQRCLLYNDAQFAVAPPGTLGADLIVAAGGLNVITQAPELPLLAKEAAVLAPSLVFGPADLMLGLTPEQFLPQTARISGGPVEPLALPLLVSLPADFYPITWENVLDKVAWFGQQLDLAAK